MTKPADMTASPVEYEGIKFYPLTMNDWGALDRWMQQSIMDDAIETCKRNALEGSLLSATLSSAQEIAARTSAATDAGMAKMNTYDGFMKLIELSSKGEFNDKRKQGMSDAGMATLVEELGATILSISQPEAEDAIDDEPVNINGAPVKAKK